MTELDPLELDATREALAKAADWRGLLDLLYDVRFVISELRHLERDIETDAATLMPKKLGETHRVLAERRMSTDRRNWQHEDLAKLVIEKEWSNIDHPQDVAKALMAAAGFSYWRVTRLRELGIDPDEYCESTSRMSVSTKGRDNA